jgi:hypothetical protein
MALDKTFIHNRSPPIQLASIFCTASEVASQQHVAHAGTEEEGRRGARFTALARQKTVYVLHVTCPAYVASLCLILAACVYYYCYTGLTQPIRLMARK